MNIYAKTMTLVALLGAATAVRSGAGVIVAEELWDTPGDTRGFGIQADPDDLGGDTFSLFNATTLGGGALEVNMTTTDALPNIDRISATGGAAAPFLGAYPLIPGKGEDISFDFYQNAAGAGPGLQFFFVGGGNTWMYNIDTSGFGVGWNSIRISMSNENGWNEDPFMASNFLTNLGSVTEVGFRLTYIPNAVGQVFAFDNLRRSYSTPEPETYAALSFALICLGITFRRRLQDSMSGALASLKS